MQTINQDLGDFREALSRLMAAIEGSSGISRKYCSVAEITEMLGISKGTWWGWVREGIAPAPVRISNTTRWDRAEVYAFLDSRRSDI